MEDLIYSQYAKVLQKENLGKFSLGQMLVCWSLWIVLAVSGMGIFVFSILKIQRWIGTCVGIYVLIAVLLELALARFENLRRLSLFSQDCATRVLCIKRVIDKYLRAGKYDKKIEFLFELYDKAVKQREAREKSFRQAGIVVLSSIGIVVSNVANSPDNTAWQAVLYAVMAMVVVFGLAVAPFFFKGAFDSKKKVYSFMAVELRALQFMLEDDSGSPKIREDSQNLEGTVLNKSDFGCVVKKKQTKKQTRKKQK